MWSQPTQKGFWWNFFLLWNVKNFVKYFGLFFTKIGVQIDIWKMQYFKSILGKITKCSLNLRFNVQKMQNQRKIAKYFISHFAKYFATVKYFVKYFRKYCYQWVSIAVSFLEKNKYIIFTSISVWNMACKILNFVRNGPLSQNEDLKNFFWDFIKNPTFPCPNIQKCVKKASVHPCTHSSYTNAQLNGPRLPRQVDVKNSSGQNNFFFSKTSSCFC